MYALFASDRAKYMGGPVAPQQMWYWMASEVGSWSLKGFGSWGIERTEDGAFLGQVGINQPYHFPEPELGWVLLKHAEGQGFAFEAATAVLNWWWQTSQANTLVSYITPGNTRSETLATRLGATPDAAGPWPTGEDAPETTVYRHRRPQ